MIRVMLRPKWIAALALVFVLATVFVLLSSWQLSRANDNAEVIHTDFDVVKPLIDLQHPGEPIQETVAAHRVEVDGQWADDLLFIVTDKGFRQLDTATVVGTDDESIAENEAAGRSGVWVTARFLAESAASSSQWVELVVALGWAESMEAAKEILPDIQLPEGTQTLLGRFYPVEPVNTAQRIQELEDASGTPTYALSSVAVASMLNLWQGELSSDRYNGYLIAEFDVEPLRMIHTQAPEEEVHLNLLNLFYAAEWVFFAGFAGYIWYRLVRDEYQAELEQAAEAAGATEEPPGASTTSEDSKDLVN